MPYALFLTRSADRTRRVPYAFGRHGHSLRNERHTACACYREKEQRRVTAQHGMMNKCTKKTAGCQATELAILRQSGIPTRGIGWHAVTRRSRRSACFQSRPWRPWASGQTRRPKHGRIAPDHQTPGDGELKVSGTFSRIKVPHTFNSPATPIHCLSSDPSLS